MTSSASASRGDRDPSAGAGRETLLSGSCPNERRSCPKRGVPKRARPLSASRSGAGDDRSPVQTPVSQS